MSRSWTSSTRRTKPPGSPESCRHYPRVQATNTPRGPEWLRKKLGRILTNFAAARQKFPTWTGRAHCFEKNGGFRTRTGEIRGHEGGITSDRNSAMTSVRLGPLKSSHSAIVWLERKLRRIRGGQNVSLVVAESVELLTGDGRGA